MYIGKEAYALYWKVVGLSPWLALFFHLFVTLLAADYRLTNNGYNASVCIRFLKSLMRREGKMPIVTGICFSSSSVVVFKSA